MEDVVGVNAGLLLSGGVQLLLQQRFCGACARGSFGVSGGADASTLDGQCLVHDRAASCGELKVGDCTATGRLVGGGGE